MKAPSAFFLSVDTARGIAPRAPHHAFAAEFDAKELCDVTGVLTRVGLRNPHA